MRRPLAMSLLMAIAMLAFLNPTTALAAGEKAAVAEFHQVLQETMKQGAELGFQGRYAKLAQPLTKLFDFPTMTKFSLQRHWDNIAVADKRAIIDAFAGWSIATYAARFSKDGGQSFIINEVRPGPRNLTLVETQIRRPGKDDVTLTYVLRAGDNGPQAIDLLAQGKFSEIARQRAEISSIFARTGAAGLVEQLQAKTAALAAP